MSTPYLFLDWQPVSEEAEGPHGLVATVTRDGDGWRWRVFHRDAGTDGVDRGRTLRRQSAEATAREVMAIRVREIEESAAEQAADTAGEEGGL